MRNIFDFTHGTTSYEAQKVNWLPAKGTCLRKKVNEQSNFNTENLPTCLRTFSDLGGGKFRLFISKIYVKLRKKQQN